MRFILAEYCKRQEKSNKLCLIWTITLPEEFLGPPAPREALQTSSRFPHCDPWCPVNFYCLSHREGCLSNCQKFFKSRIRTFLSSNKKRKHRSVWWIASKRQLFQVFFCYFFWTSIQYAVECWTLQSWENLQIQMKILLISNFQYFPALKLAKNSQKLSCNL